MISASSSEDDSAPFDTEPGDFALLLPSIHPCLKVRCTLSGPYCLAFQYALWHCPLFRCWCRCWLLLLSLLLLGRHERQCRHLPPGCELAQYVVGSHHVQHIRHADQRVLRRWLLRLVVGHILHLFCSSNFIHRDIYQFLKPTCSKCIRFRIQVCLQPSHRLLELQVP